MENRFFEVTITDKWIVTDLGFTHSKSHKDIANGLPLKNKRITNERYREIETTGKYYLIHEVVKGGKTFVFEIN